MDNDIIETVDALGRPLQVPNFKSILPQYITIERRVFADNPILTIVTRSYKKPNCLRNCINSVDAITNRNFEHIILKDTKGLGLAAADQALDVFKEENHGKYVMVLDDDDLITNVQFVSFIQDISNRYNPKLIIWRGMFTQIETVLPLVDANWGVKPIRTYIGSFNYCVERELYSACISSCSSGSSGDFDFLSCVWKQTPPKYVYWLKKILVKTQQKSLGKTKDIEGVI